LPIPQRIGKKKLVAAHGLTRIDLTFQHSCILLFCFTLVEWTVFQKVEWILLGKSRLGMEIMSRVGVPIVPVGTTKGSSEVWHKLLAQMPRELLHQADIHELRLLCQLFALSDALRKKMEADPNDLESCRMQHQVEVILKWFRHDSGSKTMETESDELKAVDDKDNFTN